MTDTETRAFVLRSDKMASPMYFVGIVEVTMGYAMAISPVILNAYKFATEAEAEGAIDELGLTDDFKVSECSFGFCLQ